MNWDNITVQILWQQSCGGQLKILGEDWKIDLYLPKKTTGHVSLSQWSLAHTYLAKTVEYPDSRGHLPSQYMW